ncbi:MAG TPA: hypothetical protein VNT75_12855 [Symbiobacteriaceae bacterium]|nr:hypothetical protein [Symbiobacteriaceae bacterium]
MRPFRSGAAKVLFLISCLCLAVGQAFAASPSLFTNMPDAIGVAATRDRLFVTTYCNDPRILWAIDSAGNKTAFATLPNRGAGCYEDYLAVSPGLGGFPANYIYVVQGGNIIQVSADGASVSLFATIPGFQPTHNGITFDQVGTFGYDMILTGANGTVWRVTSGGSRSQIAAGLPQVEGPVVAPMSLAPYGGWILAAAENVSRVYAISPVGAVQVAANIPSAESVHIIPMNVCNFGSTGGAFFSAIYPTHLAKFPASDFAGLGGQIIVTSEGGGSYRLSSNGTALVTSVFHGNIGQHEGSAFVDCAVPPCSINPDLNFNAPLSETATASMSAGGVLPIRFTYGTCSGFIRDESVIVLVVDHANPDNLITAWVYGSDVAINDIAHEYAVDLHAGHYGLSAGMTLDVMVFLGGDLAATAQVQVTP